MSATGRGAVRHAYDDYPTPAWAIEAALDRIPLPADGYVLEPCAGDGRILRAVQARWPHRGLRAVEINGHYEAALRPWAITHIADFRVWAQDHRRTFAGCEGCGPTLIITNPPYSIAREIVDAAFAVARPDATIAMLLRLGFLESDKRRDWWQDHPLDALYVLSKRPSFTGTGTNFSAYGWFVWGGTEKGVFVL